MNKRANLQSLCETRLPSHANALYTLKSAFTAVVIVMGYLEEDGDGKARCYLLTIKSVEFIIILVIIEHVHQSRLPLTTFMQSKQCNMCQRGNHYNRLAAAVES